ncbi:hypothetical protein N0V88_004032 [Collariella sp. IMI 366227]|nr:hypothetical protein N0V88_004032 [Collariella sp. IMI 366227]
MEANERKTSEQPKRRACDECRGRKLACSKDIDGCSRCKREGIKCVYSPQKRMGRPRKHRPVEVAEPKAVVAEPPREAPKEDIPSFIMPNFEFDSTISMDLDLSFLDMNNADVNFLDLVDPSTQFPPAPDQLRGELGVAISAKETHPGPGAFWPVGSGLAEINFDEPPAPPSPPPAPEITAEDLAQILSADLTETLPSLSPASSSSPSTHASPPAPEEPPICGCLPSLYLALASLQTLPTKVNEAMLIARTASKAAHDTILCSICGDPPLATNCKPPITSLQSLMMLGALLPSLSNAYMRILSMVDSESAAADVDQRKIMFSLRDYGGLWGWAAKLDSTRCNAAGRLEGLELEPLLWRLTVRALLKLDVYGINDLATQCPGEAGPGFNQPGLKDIIKMMEERSRQRHEMMDAMVASGQSPKPSCEYVPLSSATDKPTCLRIIDIAKRSMDDLVIP